MTFDHAQYAKEKYMVKTEYCKKCHHEMDMTVCVSNLCHCVCTTTGEA